MKLFLEIPHWGLIGHDVDMRNPRLNSMFPMGWPTLWGWWVTDYKTIPLHFP